MKALFWLYHVLCFACYCYAVPQVPRMSVYTSSLTGNISPMNSYIDIPWLASMPGNCQGIVLTPWLILSTANCLKKSKPLRLDISGVNDPESIPHGQRICLHPKFNLKDENDPVKADIGLVIFEEPIYGDEIPLSQSTNISLKSCSKCQYKSCYVYEYQSSKKLGTTRVKKIDVQLLDFSTCHHQHSYLEKTVGLCIQSQPREDCWIQRASPVLCLLKNHWELVGLIHKTSRICQNPTVITRTAPYFSWIKRFIKAGPSKPRSSPRYDNICSGAFLLDCSKWKSIGKQTTYCYKEPNDSANVHPVNTDNITKKKIRNIKNTFKAGELNEGLTLVVKDAVKRLQAKSSDLEVREFHFIKRKFARIYRPLLEKRSQIISVLHEPTKEYECYL
ncbi:uncharacterized protein LOC114624513 [Grammomys surdaster]|uniref:uncharacterized protein LOC114624513 n=1 Tax=Grammomys surdaster TaxID=491861 RepID=UPI00109F67C7|nr:uncharacterized protein LOC114624513 [Grammomys surdaster]